MINLNLVIVPDDTRANDFTLQLRHITGQKEAERLKAFIQDALECLFDTDKNLQECLPHIGE